MPEAKRGKKPINPADSNRIPLKPSRTLAHGVIAACIRL